MPYCYNSYNDNQTDDTGDYLTAFFEDGPAVVASFELMSYRTTDVGYLSNLDVWIMTDDGEIFCTHTPDESKFSDAIGYHKFECDDFDPSVHYGTSITLETTKD